MTSLAPERSIEDTLDALDRVIEATIAPRADEIDRTGAFPSAAVAELGAAGVLGLTNAPGAGGAGGGLADAARVVERLAGTCGSTAMVVLMHYAATAVIEAHGPEDLRREIAAGRHLSTLAFSEAGSRSHFWAPVGTATADGGAVLLDAEKSWVTSAGHAHSHVWSSRPLAADGPMTLWLVPAGAAGLSVGGTFDGLGLRGNASRPVSARGVRVPASALLGADGTGLDIALRTALPCFLVLNAAFSLGVMDALLERARRHLTTARFTHLGQVPADQPVVRDRYARLLLRATQARVLLSDTLEAIAAGREDATLRILQVKAVAAEAAGSVADGVMRLCGGSAFRRELGVERRFRDSLAARVMAPTTEALHDFTARAALGLPLFEETP